MGQVFMIEVSRDSGEEVTEREVWELLMGWNCSVECEGRRLDKVKTARITGQS